MNKELSHCDITTTQEVLTTNFRISKNLKLNNSRDLLNIEEGSVSGLKPSIQSPEMPRPTKNSANVANTSVSQ